MSVWETLRRQHDHDDRRRKSVVFPPQLFFFGFPNLKLTIRSWFLHGVSEEEAKITVAWTNSGQRKLSWKITSPILIAMSWSNTKDFYLPIRHSGQNQKNVKMNETFFVVTDETFKCFSNVSVKSRKIDPRKSVKIIIETNYDSSLKRNFFLADRHM